MKYLNCSYPLECRKSIFPCTTFNLPGREIFLTIPKRGWFSQTGQTKKTEKKGTSLQCRRFLWARNLLAKVPCWNFRKRGGDGASQRERGGGGERKEKKPARKHCENEKHPLISCGWPLFWKWVADNNKTTKQSLQSKEKQAGVYHCFYLDWVTMQFSTADEASV